VEVAAQGPGALGPAAPRRGTHGAMDASGGLVEAQAVVAGLTGDVVRRAVVAALAAGGDPAARLMLPAARRDPYPSYDRIRAAGPFARSRMGWYTARHDVVSAVLRSPAFSHDFSVDPRFQTRGMQHRRAEDLVDPVGPDSMLGTDPPDHTRLRRLVAAGFTPRSVQALRPRVEEIAHDLLRDLDGPVVDVVPRYAGVLPVLVICEVLGVPARDRERFTAWGDTFAVTLDGTASSLAQRRGQRALRGLMAYFDDLFAERRAAPGDDLVSRLLAVEEDGDQLTYRELLATCLLLLAAGFETTVNLLGNGAKALLAHPEQSALLREEPARLPDAVEELARLEGGGRSRGAAGGLPRPVPGRTARPAQDLRAARPGVGAGARVAGPVGLTSRRERARQRGPRSSPGCTSVVGQSRRSPGLRSQSWNVSVVWR
jgi:cytochrome P450